MKNISVLIVEDEALIAKTLARKLARLGYNVIKIVSSGDKALAAVEEQIPDLILMDIAIKGDKDGIQTATLIQQSNAIPVVYLTAYADEETLSRASETACYGYLLKPFQEKELHATLTMAINQHARMNAQISAAQETAPQNIVEDVYTDSLTGLPSQLVLRDCFQALLTEKNTGELESEVEENLRSLAIVCLNIDRFRRINHSIGEDFGDRLIYDVSQRLIAAAADYNPTIIRCDNHDEFVLVIPLENGADSSTNIVRILLDQIYKPFNTDGQEVILTASAGISLYPYQGSDIEELLEYARDALSVAKSKGKNRIEVFRPTSAPTPCNQLSLEADLYHAMERGELQLYYQPQLSLSTGEIVGAEGLLRWIHPDRGFVSPGIFIPIAEETGLIEPIGTWVINQACQFIKDIEIKGFHNLRIAINLSGQQFKQPELIDTIERLITDWSINPEQLELEVTEQILVDNVKETQAKLGLLRERGIHIAMDDFGTGYSSLGYLQQFPFNVLKIDRCFIDRLDARPKNQVIVQSILEMSKQLNLLTVAEGVETESELQLLKQMKCDLVQGYLFCKPLPVKDFLQFIEQHSKVQSSLIPA